MYVVIFRFLVHKLFFRHPTCRQGFGRILRFALQSVYMTAHSTTVLDQSSQYRGTGPIFTVQGYWTIIIISSTSQPVQTICIKFAFCYGLNVLPADWYLRGLPVAEGLSHYDARLNRLCYAECARGAISFFFSTRIESYGCIPSSRTTHYVL